jgi:methyl-accepting chemotaxis protein
MRLSAVAANTPSSSSNFGEFFSHHGVWAPGVRLFRRVGFAAKAALISVVFLVPIGSLLVAYLSAKHEKIAFAEHERAGVRILRGIEPWLQEVQKARGLALTGRLTAADFGALEAAERNAKALIDAQPNGVDVGKPLADAMKAHDAARSAIGAGTMQAYVEAVLSLRTGALDASQLSLDPDQATYYLMTMATDPVSAAIESIARSRPQSEAIGDAATPAALRELYGVAITGRERIGDIADQAARAEAAEPRIAARLAVAEATKPVLAYYDAADQAWFGATFTASAASLDAPAQAAVTALRRLSDDAIGLLDELLQDRIDTTARDRNQVLGLVLASLCLVGYLFYSFYKVMDGGLGEVARHLRAMTEGDLTTSPRPWGRDEAAQLMTSLSEMQHFLRGIVSEVRGASDRLVNASGEIASASSDLSQRSESAAANLEESASAIEQISATVQQTSDHAQAASRIAVDNASVAELGGRTIASVIQTMQSVQGSSSRIENIIGVIDGIAFQTNILALNAAVEAARAGEQGKGFAVVATEVRSLAQRSANAAREIKALISASVEQVGNGTRIVDEAGRTMQALVATAERMRGLLAEISSRASEQTAGVGQIGESIQALDLQTQQNAALVQQTASAGSALHDQAVALADRVARFKLA